MDLLVALETFFLSAFALIVYIGAPSIFLGVYIESKPKVRFDGKTGYIDYPAGLLIESHKASIELGRMPYFNRRAFRRILLPPMKFANLPTAQFEVTFETSLANETLPKEKWNLDSDKGCICLKRSSIPKGGDNYVAHTSCTQERSTLEIRRLVTQEIELTVTGEITKVALTLKNNSDYMIKDYEIQRDLPQIDKFDLGPVTRIDVRDTRIDVNERDFSVRYDVPTKDAGSYANFKKIHPLFLGTIDLEPGKTVVEFEYVQSSQEQTTLSEEERGQPGN